MSLALLSHYLMPNMFQMCGIPMQAEAVLQPASGYHTTPAKPHRNTNTHRTETIQPMK